MTVAECTQFHKTDKVSKLWICPDVVNEGSIGQNYVYSSSIDCKPPHELTVRQVRKRWIEDNTLCIVYCANDCPIVLT